VWDISAGPAGTLGSLAFLGMTIGAVLRRSDVVGRKRAVTRPVRVHRAVCASDRTRHGPAAGSWPRGTGADSTSILVGVSVLNAALLLTVIWHRRPTLM
jgi:hypothetical protein